MVTDSPTPPRARDLGIPESLYPFTGRMIDVGGARMHYLDEGTGEPVLMLHGNPSWSFYYRNLVAALRDRYRCIVPDHIGCGLSEKPGDDRYAYTLERRVADIETLVDALGIDEPLTLVVHDWGGMIGMAWAVRHPERVRRLVILNTSAFHLPRAKGFPLALRLCRTPLGTLLIRGFNAFSGVAARVCVKRAPMPPDVRRAYTAPYRSWADRIATLRFVQDIPLKPGDRAYPIVDEVESKVAQFTQTPMLICWGLRDFVFDKHFLALWEEAFRGAEVHRFPDCGHYILEDAADEVIGHIRAFLERT